MSSSSSTKDVFDPAALIGSVEALLPQSSHDSSTTTAQLSSPYDAIAALAHALMTAVGFRLIGLGEDHRLAASSGAGQGSSSNQGDDDKDKDDEDKAAASQNRLPAEWNARGPESYAFRYRHNQSAMEFLLKLVRVGGRVLIHALAVEDNKTATLDIQVADYTSAAFFPYPRSSSSDSEPLLQGFIGSSRVQDLASLFKINIIQKLVPGLQKEGYHEDSSANSSSSQTAGSGPSQPRQPPTGPRHEYDPLADPRFQPPPARPRRPDEDDHNYPHFDPFGITGPRNPATIGDRDLNPLGIPPGRFGGGPPPLFGGGDNGGGMIVGPDHPLFRDRFGPSGPGGVGPDGGPGGLPPGAVPPGARFDPIGPFGPMGPGAGGPRRPGSAGRGRGGPLGGDPDWDDVPPPRNSDYDNMFM